MGRGGGGGQSAFRALLCSSLEEIQLSRLTDGPVSRGSDNCLISTWNFPSRRLWSGFARPRGRESGFSWGRSMLADTGRDG